MDKYIKSPLNYTGGKYKILDQIIPAFPENINAFIDLFAGGLNVGINVNAKKTYANDQNSYIIDLFRYFEKTGLQEILLDVKNCINQFELSETNTDGYLRLRQAYNKEKRDIYLFVLTCFSFNHQIRFNGNHEFNTPFGKNRSAYNPSIEHNLIRFVTELQNKNIVFTNADFMNFDFSILGENDLVYCDPPYLITTGSYNDGKRGFKDWTETEESQLLELLDNLNQNGINFALSNVFRHKGKTNSLLSEWSKKYYVHGIEKNYSNCSYHGKGKDEITEEVLITNYEGAGSGWKQIQLET